MAISTRYSLDGPTLQNKVLRMLGGCDEVQAISVLASSLSASTAWERVLGSSRRRHGHCSLLRCQ